MAARSYGQHCAVAKSLDVVGDRWTLLIVRDLLDGPRRYGELLAALAPIATDMLAGRLRDLEAHGVVVKRVLPKPASTAVYELTDAGRSLEEVVDALARWGRPLVETRTPGDTVRPEWLSRAVRAFVRPDRRGPQVTVRFVLPEGVAALAIGPHAVDVIADADAPVDVTLIADIETLTTAMNPDRAAEIAGLVESGELEIQGDPQLVQRVASFFGTAQAQR